MPPTSGNMPSAGTVGVGRRASRRLARVALAALVVAGVATGCAATASGPQGEGSGPVTSAPAASSAAAPGTMPPSGATSASGPVSGSAGTPAVATSPVHPASPSPAATPKATSRCAGGATTTSSAAVVGAPALQAIQFTDASHGWAAGDGRIVATSDGGRTWTTQYSGTVDLYQVDFIDDAHGWASGVGALLRTTDGGATWASLGEPCGTVASVHFVSKSLGWAIATGPVTPVVGGLPAPLTGGMLLRTTDGGVTWTPVTGAPARPESVCFTSPSDGYLGTPGLIWRTTDGGRSWTRSFSEPPVAKGFGPVADTPDLECAGPGGAWVLFLGEGAAMMHSPYLAYATRDGHAWHGVFEEAYMEQAIRPRLHLPQGPGSEPAPFSAISPVAAAFTGYTPPAGWGAAPLDLALNTSAGVKLTGEGNVAAINEPLAVAFLSTTQGWVVGENLKTRSFSIEATTDGGHTWTTQYQIR